MARIKQASFEYRTHGGKRAGAGRKPAVAGRPGIAHTRRPSLNPRHPVHVTLRLRADAPSLRNRRLSPLVRDAIAAGKDHLGIRICHFAILSNHLHLLVEADDRAALTRGLRGLTIRIARRVNRHTGRHGALFADRYHAHHLATPSETRNALRYVLLNARHHEAERGHHLITPGLDPHSSAAYFWLPAPPGPAPIALPRTWLLMSGWRRSGPIDRPRDVHWDG